MVTVKRHNVERKVSESAAKRLEKEGYKVIPTEEHSVDKAQDLNKMKATELKEMAKEKGIEGYSSMTKEELVIALSPEEV